MNEWEMFGLAYSSVGAVASWLTLREILYVEHKHNHRCALLRESGEPCPAIEIDEDAIILIFMAIPAWPLYILYLVACWASQFEVLVKSKRVRKIEAKVKAEQAEIEMGWREDDRPKTVEMLRREMATKPNEDGSITWYRNGAYVNRRDQISD